MFARASLVLGVMATSLTLNASFITIDMVNSGGVESNPGTLTNSRVYTAGAGTVTVTGWSVGPGASDTFTRGQVGFFSTFGLGVCGADQGVDCTPPFHQIDNSGHYEFLLFQFSPGVQALSVTLQSFSSNDVVSNPAQDGRDTSYFFGAVGLSTPLGLTLSGLSGIGFGPRQDEVHTPEPNPFDPTHLPVTETINVGGGGNALLFGAIVDGSGDDFFKIQSLTLNTAPEPATLGLLGAALLALGVWRRRRQ